MASLAAREQLKQQVLEGRLPFQRQRHLYRAYCEAARTMLNTLDTHLISLSAIKRIEPMFEAANDHQGQVFTITIAAPEGLVCWLHNRNTDKVSLLLQKNDGDALVEQFDETHISHARAFALLVQVHANLKMAEERL